MGRPKGSKNKTTSKLNNWQRNYVIDSIFKNKSIYINDINRKDALKFTFNEKEYTPSQIEVMSVEKIKELFNIDIPESKPENITNDIISKFTVIIKDKYKDKFVKTPIPPKKEDNTSLPSKEENTPLPITPFDENEINPSIPSIGSKTSNDIDNVNPADAYVENNNNSGNSSKSNTTVVKDTPNITVNKQEQVEVRDNPLPNIVDNLTPASSSANSGAEVVNLKAQQETNVDSINPALPPSELAKRKRVKKVKLVNKNLTTEQQDITFNNLNVIRDSVNNNADMSNDGKKQINNLLDNIEKSVDTPQDVDVINELAGVMTKELEQGVENTTEDINTKLREFLTTYDPNLVDFSSPDATKQYALLTTHLLKQLSDKIEFFPQVEKGVKKVEKIQAEVNQGNNITKAGQINIEPQKEKQGSNPLIDGLYEKYIDFNGIKYLDLNDHHPSLVIGGLKL